MTVKRTRSVLRKEQSAVVSASGISTHVRPPSFGSRLSVKPRSRQLIACGTVTSMARSGASSAVEGVVPQAGR